MIVQIDSPSPIPPYEQLREQIAAMVLSGVLATGDRLPTIRQLARDLKLATGTIARAYRQLEADGLVVSDGRRGTFVAHLAGRAGSDDRREAVTAAARAFVTTAIQHGLDERAAADVIQSAFAQLEVGAQG